METLPFVAIAATPGLVDMEAPMSLGALVAMVTSIVAIVAVLITWLTFYYRRVEFKAGEKKRSEEEDAKFQTLIVRACREFTNSEEYRIKQDREMIQIAGNVVDEEFRVRSSSFVGSETYSANRSSDDRRYAQLESAVSEIKKSVAVVAEKIAEDVARRVAHLIQRGE